MEREQLKHITLMARYLATFYEKIDGYQKQYYTMLEELALFQKGIDGYSIDFSFLSSEEPLEKRVIKEKESMTLSYTASCLLEAQEHLGKAEEVLKEIVPILKTYSNSIDKLYEVNKSLGECISYLAEVSLLDEEEKDEMRKKSIWVRYFSENDA